MKITSIVLLLLVLFTSQADQAFYVQDADFTSLDHAGLGLSLTDLITVANFYGCHRWDKETCLQCSKGFFFNKKGVCCEISPLCAFYNRAEGICQGCYQGYSIVDGRCQLARQDAGCAKWNGNVCVECSRRWYLNAQQICVRVDDQCASWNNQGVCLNCYGGYALRNGRCVVDPDIDRALEDPFCAQWDGKQCRACASRAFFNRLGRCQQVDPQCQTFDPLDGQCLSCYGGYAVRNGQCIRVQTKVPLDIGCSVWNSDLNTCLQCSTRYFFSSLLRCQKVDDQCKNWQKDGRCSSCYQGYALAGGKCLLSIQDQAVDAGCFRWDWKNKICVQCSKNWVFNQNGVCVPVSSQCRSFDQKGACLSCFAGYVLASGACFQSTLDQLSDVGCAQWDWPQRKCLRCSQGWVFGSLGRCEKVSDLCATYDQIGNCLTCYVGFTLRQGRCEKAPQDDRVIDLGCALWDWNRRVCLKCSLNWFFDSNGKCVQVSDQCKTFDRDGACLRCYEGYQLNAGRCLNRQSQVVIDLGCAKWSWKDQVCLQCAKNWVFNQYDQCVMVSDQCRTHDVKGNCLSCYVGYVLQSGKCILDTTGQNVNDVGCAQWDWARQICLKCSEKWFFNRDSVCVPMSDQCATVNQQGVCTSCYKGYRINQGRCVQIVQRVSDPNCATFDWDRQLCLKQATRHYFNAQRVCVPVSDTCSTFNELNGACTSCYGGYVLRNNQCVLGNALCKTANSSGACTSCFQGYLLSNGNCLPLSKLANLALYYEQCCPEKLAELNSKLQELKRP